MKKNKVLEEFEILSEQLGFKVINGRGSFSGDSCTIKEEKLFL